MTSIQEGNVEWTFGEDWSVVKYDDWAFYRNQFQGCADGNKAMDLLAIQPGDNVLWMVEAKDYRRHHRNPDKGPLPMEVAEKARDTLAGLLAASANAVDEERTFARTAVKSTQIRVVLHIEQATKSTKLFPRVIDPADAKMKLKQLLKAIAPHPVVMSTATAWSHWTTDWKPQ